MKRFRWRVLTLATVLILAPTIYAGPVLLATIHKSGGLGGEPPPADNIIEFRLSASSSPAPSSPAIGQGIFWTVADVGTSADYDMSNSEPFTDFSHFLTNGIDDHLNFLALVPGSGGGDLESSWLINPIGEDGAPDLLGSQLDFVRLTINELSFERFEQAPGVFIDVVYDISYELYGVPVPDPSTLALLATSSYLVGFYKRRRKALGREDERTNDPVTVRSYAPTTPPTMGFALWRRSQ